MIIRNCQTHFPRKLELKLIEDGKIVHNPQLKVFTVAGSKDFYATKLYPKESCTCPAKKDCYHIIAAKISIGMNVEPKNQLI